jgi:hypothetical protein
MEKSKKRQANSLSHTYGGLRLRGYSWDKSASHFQELEEIK